MKKPVDPDILDVLKVIRQRQRFALNQATQAKRQATIAARTPQQPPKPAPLLPPTPVRPPGTVVDLFAARPARPLPPPDPITAFRESYDIQTGQTRRSS